MSMRTAFEDVYAHAEWHTGSGPGSGEAETAVWRRFLAGYMKAHQVRSVLDLGCGDWQSTRLVDWTGINYHGVDVVPAVIDACSRQYAAPGVTFECADVTACGLPPADLVICKEVLQHWPLKDIAAFRERVQWREHVLVVNDYAPLLFNPDITPGGYRPLDLTAPPLYWPVRELCRWTLQYADGTRETKVVHAL